MAYGCKKLHMGYEAQRFGCAAAIMIMMVLWAWQWGMVTADQEHELELCSQVLQEFLPCVMYLSGRIHDAQPVAACCSCIDTLNHLVGSHKYGPQRFCQCIEDFTDVIKIGMDPTRIANLPDKCQLHLSFPISVTLDCSRVT